METFGFDYVFALSIDKVNNILYESMENIDVRISYTTIDPDSGSTLTLQGKLSPWYIVRGGQNKLLRFNIPFQSGSLSLEGGAITGRYDLTDVAVEVEINLGWVGSDGNLADQGSSVQTQLIFTPTTTTNVDNPGYVAALQIFDKNHNLDTVSSGLLKVFMADVLVKNKDNLRCILADIDPTPAHVGSWLAPQKWDYFYIETDNQAGLSALCFLCMLTNKDLPPPAFDSSTLTADNNSILLVSQEMLFQHIVLPGIQNSFPSSAFVVNSTAQGYQITNKGDVELGKITADAFTIWPSNTSTGIQSKVSGGGPLKFLFGLADLPDASYSWDIETVNLMIFDSASQGVSFQKDPNPQEHHSETVQWYDWLILATLGITSLPGLISFILNLVQGFQDQINEMGIDHINDVIEASIGGTVVNLTSLVEWSKNGQSFHATQAGMDGIFFVRGNLS